MSDLTIETFQHNGKTVRIEYDPEPEHCNPRDCDNLGIMLANGHRRYTLGDEPFMKGKHSPYDDAARALEHFAERGMIRAFPRWLRICMGATVVLPLGLYDHSGISMFVGGGAHAQDPGGWDSGLVGFIFDTADTREMCGTPLERIEEGLRAEVEVYDQYLTGQVYSYLIEDEDGDIVDSCGGFLGSIEYVKQAARDDAGYTCKHCGHEITRSLGPIVDPDPEDPNAWAHYRQCKVCHGAVAWGKEGAYHVNLDVSLANHHKAETEVRRACIDADPRDRDLTVAEPAQFVGSYE